MSNFLSQKETIFLLDKYTLPLFLYSNAKQTTEILKYLA